MEQEKQVRIIEKAYYEEVPEILKRTPGYSVRQYNLNWKDPKDKEKLESSKLEKLSYTKLCEEIKTHGKAGHNMWIVPVEDE